MRAAGIDIGSRTIKLAVLEEGRLAAARVEYNSHDPIEVCRHVLEGVAYDAITATGYGRRLFGRYWECRIITEIRAVALGARLLAPACRTVLDIGGQDTKAVSVAGDGGIRKFEMNDKCAAGTGRFLEVMAAALSYSMNDFISSAQSARRARKVNSMCTVFAESEVISMVSRGAPREEVALGIHQAVAGRAVSMLKRVPVADDILFCGGAALNRCLHRLIEEALGKRVHVPDEPQIVAAIGCALSAEAE
jgi:predicted CoA-substrate-specific enzyme activase